MKMYLYFVSWFFKIQRSEVRSNLTVTSTGHVSVCVPSPSARHSALQRSSGRVLECCGARQITRIQYMSV